MSTVLRITALAGILTLAPLLFPYLLHNLRRKREKVMPRIADTATIIRDGKIVEKRETEGEFLKRIAGEVK